jgi:putative glutamine amidotransferase
MSAPAIGICAAVERARWTVWDEEAALITRAYARAVHRAGGLAMVLPPYDSDALAGAPLGELLGRLDGLILAGGSDVDPACYGAEREPETGPTWPERDAFELALTRAALERGTPVLGICRGMQLLNVALGGTLHQHLPAEVGHSDHLHTPGFYGDHQVRLEPGSLAARAAGAERLAVKSHHHQGLDRIGEGLAVTGWAVDDDAVEAVELPGGDYALGVLWHPEEDGHSLVISSLVAAAQSGPGTGSGGDREIARRA